jgi:large subunit ribosomal protein L7/L12
MAKSFEKIVDEIGALSVLELSELIKAIETKFGVSSAMPVMAGAPAQATAAEAKPAEEKANFKVTLKEQGPDKIKTIKALREVKAGLGLSEAKAAVEGAPTVIAESVSKEEADKMKKKLEEAGAKVELS